MKKIFPALALLAGLYWMYQGAAIYRLWANGRLGGGFMPALAGTAAVVFSSATLLGKPDGRMFEPFRLKAFLPVASVALVIAASFVIGLILSLVLFIHLWLQAYERYSFAKSAITAVSTGIVIYVVFSSWLLLPFPRGALNLL